MANHLLLGIDASLERTGLCAKIAGSKKVYFHEIELLGNLYQHPEDIPITESSVSIRFEAFLKGQQEMVSFIDKFKAKTATVCFEFYSLNSASTSLVQIAEYSSLLKSVLASKPGYTTYEPVAAQIKQFATGHGGSAKKKTNKEDIKLAVYMAWKVNMLHRSNDAVDAFVLMKMAQGLFEPSTKLTEVQKTVLERVQDRNTLGSVAGRASRKKRKAKVKK